MTEPLHTLTVSQAAEALGVSERTVWRYLKAGRLAGETVGPPGAQRTLIHDAAVGALRQGRGDGAEAAALRRRLEASLAELATAQAERDALRLRVSELERRLAACAVRPEPVTHRAWALARKAMVFAASLRSRRGQLSR